MCPYCNSPVLARGFHLLYDCPHFSQARPTATKEVKYDARTRVFLRVPTVPTPDVLPTFDCSHLQPDHIPVLPGWTPGELWDYAKLLYKQRPDLWRLREVHSDAPAELPAGTETREEDSLDLSALDMNW